MDEIDVKKLWSKAVELGKKAKEKAGEIAHDPRTQMVTSSASAILDVAQKVSTIKIGGPLVAVTTGLSLIDAIRRNTDKIDHVPADIESDPIDEFISNLEDQVQLIHRSSGLPEILENFGAFWRLDLKIEVDTRKRTPNKETTSNFKPVEHILYSIADKNGRKSYMKYRVMAGDLSGEKSVVTNPAGGIKCALSQYFWHEEDFDFSIFADAIWSTIGSSELKLVRNPDRTNGAGLCTVEPMPVEDNDTYIDLGDRVEEFARSVQRYLDAGISRAYVLHGVPGTGKTTHVRQYALRTNKRLLVVPLKALSTDDVEHWVDMLLPDVVLMDDMDRATSGLDEAINTLEDMRRKHPGMVVIATVNHLSRMNGALLRPGRLGKRMEFAPPSKEDKLRLLVRYADKYGVTAKFDWEPLVDKMDHEGFSHDYVRFVAEEALNCESQQDLEDAVDAIVQHIEFVGDEVEEFEKPFHQRTRRTVRVQKVRTVAR